MFLATALAFLVGILGGLLFARLFVKFTKNDKFCLTKFGTFVLNKRNRRYPNLSNSMVGGREGAFLGLVDVVLIALIISLVENWVEKFMAIHSIFIIPAMLFVLTSIYLFFRAKEKIKGWEIFTLVLIYLITIIWLIALI